MCQTLPKAYREVGVTESIWKVRRLGFKKRWGDYQRTYFTLTLLIYFSINTCRSNFKYFSFNQPMCLAIYMYIVKGKSHSVMSDSLWPHGLWRKFIHLRLLSSSARLLGTPITTEEDASRLEVSSSWEQEEIRTHWHEQALPGHTWRLVHNSFSRWVSPAGMGGGPSKRLHREGKSVTIPRHPQLSAFLGIFGRIMRWKKTHLFLRLGSTRSPPDHSLALGSSLI